MRHAALLALFLLPIAACGGGGSAPPPIEVEFDLGLVRADTASEKTVRISNPIEDKDATVRLEEDPTGPFAPSDGALPGVAPVAGELQLRVTVTPAAPGSLEGELTLEFTGSGGKPVRTVIVTLRAEVESPSIALLDPALSFGDVRIGESAFRDLRVQNTSMLTPVRVASLSPPPAGFRYGGDIAPRVLAAGAVFTTRITYEPTRLDAVAFDVVVGHDAVSPSLVAHVTAGSTTWIPEIVTDFGTVPVVGDETGWLELEVPAHAISLSIEALGPESSPPGMLGLEGPGGRVYENEQLTGEYLWTPGEYGIFTATVPNSDRPSIQLVPGGGTYRFRLFLFSGSAASLDVRAIVHNRPGGVAADGVFDLNVYLAPALGIAASEALQETRLQGILDRVETILGQQGLSLGRISYFDLQDATFDDVTGTEFPDLLRESGSAPETRLNLFFVRQAIGGGVLGVAARVPGPALNGTAVSGVMVDYDFGSIATAGHVTAHELCHYLGLFHTVESNGSHDMIDDTVECPSSGTSPACPTVGNDYLMHWSVLNADPVVTDGQGLVLRAHPLVRPPTGLQAAPLLGAPYDAGEVETLGEGWCGTPGCEHAKTRTIVR